MVKAYVPFRFRYTPIVQTVLINFRKDPDYLYQSFELQIFEYDGKRMAQVLALREDGFKDVYQEPGIQLDDGELEMIIGGRGVGEVNTTTVFTKGYFSESDGHVRIGFTFKDKEDREIDFSVDENLEKDSHHLSWLPSIGSRLDNPESLPLFFLYGFDFIRKNGTEVQLLIDGTEHTIDPYAFPKNFQSRLNIQYSLESVVTNFNESRQAKMPLVDLDENFEAFYRGKQYKYKLLDGKPNLHKIIMEKGIHPVEVEFNPPFPDYTEIEESVPLFGEFTINPAKELGSLTGKFNVTRQKNKVIINLTFSEGWNPNKKETYFELLRERTSTRLTDWYKSYQCTEVIDLDTFETSVTWKKVDPNRNKQV